MREGKPSARNKIVRSANRAHYDKETLYQVLDAGFICHVSYLYEGASVIIPTAYARKDDMIYIHGAMKNRMMNSILTQNQACVAVTHLDGMVLARSAFHHSFNYRSAVVFGTPQIISNKHEKTLVLKMITDKILPNRWNEVREPSEKELTATLVIGIKINEASVKIRSGAPIDDKEDYNLPIWAGELPMQLVFSEPIPDPVLAQGIELPQSVADVNRIID